jgi:hypothetical protein
MTWSILTEPVFSGLALGGMFEFRRPQRKTWPHYSDPAVDDESVASFLERRLGGPDVGNNMVSAVLHGIYAGDINQLSARSLLPKFWYEEAYYGSIMNATLKHMQAQVIVEPLNDVMLRQELGSKISGHVREIMAGASVYTVLGLYQMRWRSRYGRIETWSSRRVIRSQVLRMMLNLMASLQVSPSLCPSNANSAGQNKQKYAITKIYQRNIHPPRSHCLHTRQRTLPGQYSFCDRHGSKSLLQRPESPP